MSSFSPNFVAEFLLADSNLVGLFFDRVLFFGRAGGSDTERRFVPDRMEHDLEDPDLGAAGMDDNIEPGGG